MSLPLSSTLRGDVGAAVSNIQLPQSSVDVLVLSLLIPYIHSICGICRFLSHVDGIHCIQFIKIFASQCVDCVAASTQR